MNLPASSQSVEALGYDVAGVVDSIEKRPETVKVGDFDVAILDINLRDRKPSWPHSEDNNGPIIANSSSLTPIRPPNAAAKSSLESIRSNHVNLCLRNMML